MKNHDGKLVMNASAMHRALGRMASEIVERNPDAGKIGFVGIRTRGEPLAVRLSQMVDKAEGVETPVGVLDITLYRDDVGLAYPNPVVAPTNIQFQITGKVIVLVDDVLYTGRTVRAALDAIMDFGRPAAIQLAVLIDRGLRELPITADYTGRRIETTRSQLVQVHLQEIDGKDCVFILEGGENP
jgi:pyrimidine operon attenuation protein/uracil phosphoribosyltransferase